MKGIRDSLGGETFRSFFASSNSRPNIAGGGGEAVGGGGGGGGNVSPSTTQRMLSMVKGATSTLKEGAKGMASSALSIVGLKEQQRDPNSSRKNTNGGSEKVTAKDFLEADQGQFEPHDDLIRDILKFLEQNAKSGTPQKKSLMSSMPIPGKKKTDPKLAKDQVAEFKSKINECQKGLNALTEESLLNKDTYILEAKMLEMRLVACIGNSRDILKTVGKQLKDSKDLADTCNKQIKEYESMLKCWEELLKQEEAENSYMSWSMRNAGSGESLKKQAKDKETFNVEDIRKRVRKIVKVMKYSLGCCVFYKKQQDLALKVVKQCSEILHVLTIMLSKAGVKKLTFDDDEDDEDVDDDNDDYNDDEEDEEENDHRDDDGVAISTGEDKNRDDGDKVDNKRGSQLAPYIRNGQRYVQYKHHLVEFYDHAKCADCIVVHGMALTACSGLGKMIQTSVESTKRLQKLMELNMKLDELS